MIPYANLILSSSIQNPDKVAIESKKVIDLALTDEDVTASLSSSAPVPNPPIKVEFVSNYITVHPTVSGSADRAELYFTPIYAEKLNYTQWKSVVNKNFTELESR